MGQERTSGAHLSRQLHFVGHAISVKTENQAVLVGERWTVEIRKFVRRAAGNFAAAIGTDRS
jgi:hypothetical protein